MIDLDVPTAAVVDRDGVMRQLTRRPEPPEEVTDKQLGEQGYTVRLLMRILRAIAALRRRHTPRRIDFEDVALVNGGTHRFPHDFGGRVRWWVVDAQGAVPVLGRDEDETDDRTLVLASGADVPAATIRVEEVGG